MDHFIKDPTGFSKCRHCGVMMWNPEDHECVGIIKAELEDYKRTSGELCGNCGWRMKFPDEPCKNCENSILWKLVDAIDVGTWNVELNDVDGKNWFDVKDELKKALDGKENKK